MIMIPVGQAAKAPPGHYPMECIGYFTGINADTTNFAVWEERTYVCFPGDRSWSQE